MICCKAGKGAGKKPAKTMKGIEELLYQKKSQHLRPLTLEKAGRGEPDESM